MQNYPLMIFVKAFGLKLEPDGTFVAPPKKPKVRTSFTLLPPLNSQSRARVKVAPAPPIVPQPVAPKSASIAPRIIDGVELAYCVTYAEAEALIGEMIADAGSHGVALDIETAALPAERARLEALRAERAAVTKRKLALGRELRNAEKSGQCARALASEIAALEAELRLLGKSGSKAKKRTFGKIAYAESAALDPHRSRIRLAQLFGGGRRCAIIDIARTGEAALALLQGVNATIHNASFERAHLGQAGVELGRTNCTLQAVRLTLGARKCGFAAAVAHYLKRALAKDEQASDWSAADLSAAQIEYAARDVIHLWPLAERVFSDLATQGQASAYRIANAVIPAVTRLNLRGVTIDLAAHAEAMRDLARRDAEARETYRETCRAHNLALAPDAPRTDNETRAALRSILSEEERATWPRTDKTGELAVGKNALKRLAHPLGPPLLALAEGKTLKSQFGWPLPLRVAPDTGRVYPHYTVTGIVTGRASCSGPNLHGMPRDPKFRALCKAAPGFVFCGGDYATMELRAASCFFSDPALAAVFERGDDPHTLTAARVTGKALGDVTPEERSRAKGANFGVLYGISPAGLVAQAWGYTPPIRMTLAEAGALLGAFEGSYPDLLRNRSAYVAACHKRRAAIIGKDWREGKGRVIPFGWFDLEEQSLTNCLYSYPVQGICADICMLALAAIDRALREQGLSAAPVIWSHDEIVLEARESNAERAGALLKDAMEASFLDMFPGATLNKLVDVHVGRNWAEAKEKKKEATP